MLFASGLELNAMTLLLAVLVTFTLLGKRLNRLEDDNRELRGRIFVLEEKLGVKPDA